jgi:hypothetical protein
VPDNKPGEITVGMLRGDASDDDIDALVEELTADVGQMSQQEEK